MDEIFKFERLEVWQKAKALVKDIYAEVYKFPSYERYAMSDQLRRAAVSVTSNIAEGSARPSAKEQIRFYDMAYSSLVEVRSEILVSLDLGFFSQTAVDAISPEILSIAKMLTALRKSCERRSNDDSTNH